VEGAKVRNALAKAMTSSGVFCLLWIMMALAPASVYALARARASSHSLTQYQAFNTCYDHKILRHPTGQACLYLLTEIFYKILFVVRVIFNKRIFLLPDLVFNDYGRYAQPLQ
jgi:hypothetical protein